MRLPDQLPQKIPSTFIDMPVPETVTSGGRGPVWEAAGSRAWVLMLDRIPAAKVTQALDGKHHVAYVAHVDTFTEAGYSELRQAQTEAVHKVIAGRKAKMVSIQRELALLEKMIKG